jgi:hypothetical protein
MEDDGGWWLLLWRWHGLLMVAAVLKPGQL